MFVFIRGNPQYKGFYLPKLIKNDIMEPNLHNQILKVIKEKSSVKQDIFHETLAAFKMLKEIAKTEAEVLKKEVADIDKRVTIEFKDRSEFMFEIKQNDNPTKK